MMIPEQAQMALEDVEAREQHRRLGAGHADTPEVAVSTATPANPRSRIDVRREVDERLGDEAASGARRAKRSGTGLGFAAAR